MDIDHKDLTSLATEPDGMSRQDLRLRGVLQVGGGLGLYVAAVLLSVLVLEHSSLGVEVTLPIVIPLALTGLITVCVGSLQGFTGRSWVRNTQRCRTLFLVVFIPVVLAAFWVLTCACFVLYEAVSGSKLAGVV